MKKLSLIYLTLPLIVFLCRCGGTETGNPNVIVDSDFSKATAFLSNADATNYDGLVKKTVFLKWKEKLFGTSGARVKIKAQSGASTQDFSRSPLLKLTDTDEVVSAIHMQTSDNLPTAIQMTKIDGIYYVLFDRQVRVKDELCTLVEFTLDGAITCIDSADVLSEQRAMNAKFIFDVDQRYFMVTKQGTVLVYRAQDGSLVSYDTVSKSRKTFGPSGWVFLQTIQGRDGTIYGINCRDSSSSQYAEYLSCKVSADTVEVYSANIAATPRKAFLLHSDDLSVIEDKLLIVADPADVQSLHLHLGPLGKFIDSTNFSDDLSPGLTSDELAITKNISSVIQLTLPFQLVPWVPFGVSEAPTQQVCLFPIESANLATASDCSGNNIAGGGTFPTFRALDYVRTKALIAWSNGDEICQLASNDVFTGPPGVPTGPNYKILISCNEIYSLPTLIRYLTKDVFIFGGPKKGSGVNPTKYYYYKYDLTNDSKKLLFESNKPFYVFPLK